ncbi:hypothetical protein HMPREF9318_00992 [Streptococcus urinalis FB127-CNA-2]|uniref:Polysaccharide lyase family 8, N-terminal alpha-helical domain protein n=1 Tax=Streptococcus urinalis 2285-97 TaxID=764291 RepID=G5KH58_9STRE|nr:polysaccharide lyase [Streptococcus urinalis]EHJ56037.1 polysaccharide lyase family 8, N-terminal alpha-helical domain protein [Streptococcus urinalis 2285-97]EKS21038.1 hypothetical protein HMPREF9318_00992 [Streptococcus urinalis FB127-CNA-2]VEF31047.1 hyaluronate lyase precursor HylB [Streptococcus urinalis]
MKKQTKVVALFSSIILGSLFVIPSINAEEVTTIATEVNKEQQVTTENLESAPKQVVTEKTGFEQKEGSLLERPDLQDEKEQVITTADNLVKNDQFIKKSNSQKGNDKQNEVVDDWHLYQDKAKTTEPPVIKTSQQGISIENQKDHDFKGVIYQDITIEPKQAYQLHYDVETKGITSQVFVRIIEKDDKNPIQKKEQIWYSQMTRGNEDKQTNIQHYSPDLMVSKVRLELYYDKGRGKVTFNNIGLRPLGEKKLVQIKKVDNSLETSVELPLHKAYVFKNQNLSYAIVDANNEVARIEKGVLIPKKIGKGTIEARDTNGKLQGTFSFTIVEQKGNPYQKQLDYWQQSILGDQFYHQDNVKMRQMTQQSDKEIKQILAERRNLLGTKEMSMHDLKKINPDQLVNSYRQLEKMAKQISIPTSIYYHDGKLISQIKSNMDWLAKNAYHPNMQQKTDSNWWYYEVAIPRAIVNTLTLLSLIFLIKKS